MPDKLQQAINKIDEINAQDPNIEFENGKPIAKELLYAQRMSNCLQDFAPDASDELKIAARAQHIGRWKIERASFEMNRVGYLKWRNELKKLHAEITSEILESVGFDTSFINRVAFLVQKKQIKKDEESQILEDVICLVFLQYYLKDFGKKHEEDKIVDIIQKTWSKMSEKGHKAALTLFLDETSSGLVKKALS